MRNALHYSLIVAVARLAPRCVHALRRPLPSVLGGDAARGASLCAATSLSAATTAALVQADSDETGVRELKRHDGGSDSFPTACTAVTSPVERVIYPKVRVRISPYSPWTSDPLRLMLLTG